MYSGLCVWLVGILIISKRNQTLGNSNKIIGREIQIILKEGKTLQVWGIPGKSWRDPQGELTHSLYGIKILKSVRIGKVYTLHQIFLFPYFVLKNTYEIICKTRINKSPPQKKRPKQNQNPSPPVTLKIPQHLHSLTHVRWSIEKLGNSKSYGISQKFSWP